MRRGGVSIASALAEGRRTASERGYGAQVIRATRGPQDRLLRARRVAGSGKTGSLPDHSPRGHRTPGYQPRTEGTRRPSTLGQPPSTNIIAAADQHSPALDRSRHRTGHGGATVERRLSLGVLRRPARARSRRAGASGVRALARSASARSCEPCTRRELDRAVTARERPGSLTTSGPYHNCTTTECSITTAVFARLRLGLRLGLRLAPSAAPRPSPARARPRTASGSAVNVEPAASPARRPTTRSRTAVKLCSAI